MYRNIVAAAAPLFILAGCAAPLLPRGDSLQQQKQLSFPKAGAQSTATAGNLAAMVSNYRSRHVFQLAQSINVPIMLGSKIAVSSDEPLFQTDVDGATGYCTERKTLSDVLGNPVMRTCFRIKAPGTFGSVHYRSDAGTWYEKPLSPEVGFISREIVDGQQAGPLKRELVFDGSQGNALMFSERIYDKSLQTPSRVKPIVATVASLPAAITLDGMDINVTRYDAKALTFELLKPWQ